MGRGRFCRMKDGAMSDVVGTMILMGVTLSLVTVAAYGFTALNSRAKSPLPDLSVAVSASPSGVHLVHSGGGTFNRADLQLLVAVNGQPAMVEGSTLADVWRLAPGADPAADVPLWSLGDPVDVPVCLSPPACPAGSLDLAVLLDHADGVLHANDQVEVAIVSLSRGGVIASGQVLVAADASSSLIALLIDAPAPGTEVSPGQPLHLKARFTTPVSRSSVAGVTADVSELGGPNSWTLYDDGTHGDAVAGDRVYEGYYVVAPWVAPDPAPKDLTFSAIVSGELPIKATTSVVVVDPTTPAAGPVVELSAFTNPVAPLQPVTVWGRNFTFVDQVFLTRSDGTQVVPVWSPGPTRDTQLVFLAPPNPNPSNDTYTVTVASPFSSASRPGLVVVGTDHLHTIGYVPGPAGGAGGTGETGGTGGTGGGSGPGPQGPPGPPGSNGVFPGAEPEAAPIITGISPTSGGPRTIVSLAGSNLGDVRGVAMNDGSGDHGAVWWADSTLAGEVLYFSVPTGLARGDYSVIVTTASGWAVAPQLFTLTLPAPVIDSVSPSAAPAYTQVTVSGSSLSGVQSVVLQNGTRAYAVAWAALSDAQLVFVTPPGVPVGAYHIVLSNGVDTVTSTFEFTVQPVPTPPPPSNLALTPTSGPPGSEIVITGDNLETTNRVTLNVSGIQRETVWWYEGNTVHFLVPSNVPPGSYAVEIVSDGGRVTGPDLTVTLPPAPVIEAPEPGSGRAFTAVIVRGQHLDGVQSVLLGESAVSWAFIDSGTLTFVVPAGLPPVVHDLTVRTGGGTSNAQPFEVIPPPAPTEVHISPVESQVGGKVIATGTNLHTVTHVVLTNGLVDADASWWFEGDAIAFLVPAAAAPPGATPASYTVRLVAGTGTSADAAETLLVRPVPPPSITEFSPKIGAPFTQVTITGENFVNVKSVTMNGTAVYWVAANPNTIIMITHSGIQTGWYALTVTTATGSATTTIETVGLFKATPPQIFPVYPRDVFEYVGVWATKNDTSTSGDQATIYIKFRVKPSIVMDGATYTLATTDKCPPGGAGDPCTFLSYNPFKPGNLATLPLGTPHCASGDGLFVYRYVGSVQKYDAWTYTLSFFPTFTFVSGTGGGATYTQIPITTTDSSQFFNLAATEPMLTVYDHGGKPISNDFQSCTTA